MCASICRNVLLAVLFAAASAGWAQSEPGGTPASVDLAITYSTEYARLSPGTCGCFWLQGGGADAALTLWKGFGVAAGVTGQMVSNYAPSVDFSKVSYMGGPRYTYTAWKRRPGSIQRPRFQIFGEGLFGAVHAYSGAFPSRTAIDATANSFALETGGGINLFFLRSISVRLLQVDYVRTQLPNGYAGTQNDLRLASGVSYHATSFHLRRH
jgi:outer membrane immunogenic protein